MNNFQEEDDEEEDEDDDEEEGSEEDEDEVEPKLKYERIGNAMNTILNGEECASCMAVHTKVRSQRFRPPALRGFPFVPSHQITDRAPPHTL